MAIFLTGDSGLLFKSPLPIIKYENISPFFREFCDELKLFPGSHRHIILNLKLFISSIFSFTATEHDRIYYLLSCLWCLFYPTYWQKYILTGENNKILRLSAVIQERLKKKYIVTNLSITMFLFQDIFPDKYVLLQ